MSARMGVAEAEVQLPAFRRDRRVLGWILSSAVSEAGDVAWYIGLAWSAAQISTPAGAGLVMGVGAVPRALVLLFGGALADRLDARWTMILANLGRIAVLGVAAGLVATRGLSMALLVTVAVLFGAMDALYSPAAGTLPRRMVRKDDLVRLAAARQLTSRLAVFVGAPLGGLLVAQGGLVAVMIADAASFAAIAVALAFVVRPRFPRPEPSGESLRRDLADGFRYLRRDGVARTLVVAFFGLNLCVAPVLAVGLVQRTHLDGWGSSALGWFQACLGISAGIGAIVAMRWKPGRPAQAGMLLLILQAAGCVLIGFVPQQGMFVAMAMIGFTAGLASAQLSGAFQQTIDPAYLGRTSSMVSLSDDALMPLAMTGFGALISLSDVAVACALLGGAFAALMAWSAWRLRGQAPYSGQ